MITLSGGAFTECDRGDCGTLGNWTFDHGALVLGIASALALAISVGAMHLARRP